VHVRRVLSDNGVEPGLQAFSGAFSYFLAGSMTVV
jgi:hypothetical protein